MITIRYIRGAPVRNRPTSIVHCEEHYHTSAAQGAICRAAVLVAHGHLNITLHGLPRGALPVYEREYKRGSTLRLAPYVYGGRDKESGLHVFEPALEPGKRELFARRAAPPASWYLARGAYAFEFVRSDYFIQTACARCGMDIEGMPGSTEWRDRGGSTRCPQHGDPLHSPDVKERS